MSSASAPAVADGTEHARLAEDLEVFYSNARAAERELKELVEKELATAATAEAKVTDQWRSILRMAKVSFFNLHDAS